MNNDEGQGQRQRSQREGVRSPVAIPTLVRDATGGAWQGEIVNLSARGCRVKFTAGHAMEKGRAATIGIEGLEAQSANVVWTSGNDAGFQFVYPLYEAIFENLAGRFPQADLAFEDETDEWRSA